MQKNRSIWLVLGFTFFLSACVPTNEIEGLGIISARGVDISENNEVETSINIIRFDPQADSIYTTVSGTGKTLKDAREDAGLNTGYDIFEGQINVELFGKEAAKQGISRFLEGLVRDARVSDTMKLAVSTTTAKEIFNSAENELNAIGQYLDKLFDTEVEEGDLPGATLHDFTRRTTTIGQDGLLPLIDFKDNKPVLIGMAIFKDDRYVADSSMKEAYLFNLFLNKIRNTPLELDLPLEPFEKHLDKKRDQTSDGNKDDSLSVNFISVNGDSHTKVENVKGLKFKTDVSLELDLVESSASLSVKNEEIADLLEREAEKEVKRNYEELLKKVQEVSADPFGFGKIYRANTKDGKLTEEEWYKKFPDIKVDFNVEVKLMHTGTIK